LSQTPPNQNRDGTSFVLDNSVLCGWFLANQASDYGDAIARQLSQVDAHAPWLLQLPIATRDGDLAEAAWAAGVGVMLE